MHDIVLASGNEHKIRELGEIFAHAGLTLRVRALTDVTDAANLTEPPETGTTFEQNARIKAVSYAAQTGLPCLADDSGLEIDALGGRPGVISSHYSTDGKQTTMTRAERDAANNARVLLELRGVEFAGRSARFTCCMCLADADGQVLAAARGTFEGRIGFGPSDSPADERYRVPRGTGGFGYDPLFLVAPGFERTSAELSPPEKNARSHRAAAARLISDAIRAMP
ncbi:MAG: non-canonical purine NTP pyrophosphatase [Phycisphaerales bacterium]